MAHTLGQWFELFLNSAVPDLVEALKEAREVVQDQLNSVGAQITYNEDPAGDGGYGLLERSDYLSKKLEKIDAAIAKAEGGGGAA